MYELRLLTTPGYNFSNFGYNGNKFIGNDLVACSSRPLAYLSSQRGETISILIPEKSGPCQLVAELPDGKFHLPLVK